jgi:hypothetical protein
MLKLFQPTDSKTTQDNSAFINLLYQILFSRDAEPVAQTTWAKYLAEGHSYKELFELLWKSEEFKKKAEQNYYLRKPPEETEVAGSAGTDDANTAAANLITDVYFAKLLEVLREDRLKLFEIPLVRSLVSQWRYRDMDAASKTTVTPGSPDHVLPHTAEYNELSLRSSVGLDRGSIVIYPLRSMGWVNENISNLTVLVVGARAEAELFALLSAGFRAENITMVDLVSYSPFVEIGDMHDMRFPDDTFDIVLLSHVISYSASPRKAAHELARVAKHGGLISHCEPAEQFKMYIAPHEVRFDNAKRYSSCADLLEVYAPYAGQVIYQLEPKAPYTEVLSKVAVTFEVDKSPRSA